MSAPEVEETRAEIARRRLTELAATFQASLPETDSVREAIAEDSSRYADDEPSESKVRKRRSITLPHVKFLALAAVVAVLGVGWWLLSAGFASEPATSDAVPLLAQGDKQNTAVKAEPETLIVHVAGSVKKPGIVTIKAGSRVDDAIKAAGGVTGKPDLSDVNLARPLVDGEQVRIGLPPAIEPASSGSVPGVGTAGGSSNSGLINLNTASQVELETLPGVGPVTAQSILEWRQKNQGFHQVEDLLDVRGIGEATLERLRPLVTV